GPGRPPGPGPRPPATLVGLATPTSSTSPYLPLPTTSHLAAMKITIYGWSTSRNSREQGLVVLSSWLGVGLSAAHSDGCANVGVPAPGLRCAHETRCRA